jgi:hypothetical protein
LLQLRQAIRELGLNSTHGSGDVPIASDQ